jgi:hypothetical protein
MRLLTILQAYLKFSKIDFTIAAANNHASPSGALPFIIPASPEPYKHMQPVPSGKLQRWAMNNSKKAIEESEDLRYEAYLSLLDHRIRRAWVRSTSCTLPQHTDEKPAVLHLSLPELHYRRRATLHPPRIKQSLRPPHNSPRATIRCRKRAAQILDRHNRGNTLQPGRGGVRRTGDTAGQRRLVLWCVETGPV